MIFDKLTSLWRLILLKAVMMAVTFNKCFGRDIQTIPVHTQSILTLQGRISLQLEFTVSNGETLRNFLFP